MELSKETTLLIEAIARALKEFYRSGAKRMDFEWGSIYRVSEMVRVDITQK